MSSGSQHAGAGARRREGALGTDCARCVREACSKAVPLALHALHALPIAPCHHVEARATRHARLRLGVVELQATRQARLLLRVVHALRPAAR
eukprot:2653558-Rhodomonas_salina.1